MMRYTGFTFEVAYILSNALIFVCKTLKIS